MPVVESHGHLVAYWTIEDLQPMLCKDKTKKKESSPQQLMACSIRTNVNHVILGKRMAQVSPSRVIDSSTHHVHYIYFPSLDSLANPYTKDLTSKHQQFCCIHVGTYCMLLAYALVVAKDESTCVWVQCQWQDPRLLPHSAAWASPAGPRCCHTPTQTAVASKRPSAQ